MDAEQRERVARMEWDDAQMVGYREDDTEEPEEMYCEEVVFYGSPNPNSFRFGPDEYCEDIAVEGTDRCGKHTYDHDGDY